MIFSAELARSVRTGRKTMTRRPTKPGEPCRYQPGKHYAVQPGRGHAATCRIHVTAIRQEAVGDIAYADARQEGFNTTEDFKAYWVAIHDKAWLQREHHMLDQAENDDGVTLDRDTWITRRSLDRFDDRHARHQVWVITFQLHVQEEVRFLGASMTTVDGGKARLMSARKLKPGRATIPEKPMTDNEASGYVTSPARAPTGEPEPVSREAQRQITDRAWTVQRQWASIEKAHRDRDRSLLSREDQIIRLRRAARLRSVDARNEIRLLERMLETSTDDAFNRKVQRTEARVFTAAA